MIDHAEIMAKLVCMVKQANDPGLLQQAGNWIAANPTVSGGVGGGLAAGGFDLAVNKDPQRALKSGLMGSALGAIGGAGIGHFNQAGRGQGILAGIGNVTKDLIDHDNAQADIGGNRTLSINKLNETVVKPNQNPTVPGQMAAHGWLPAWGYGSLQAINAGAAGSRFKGAGFSTGARVGQTGIGAMNWTGEDGGAKAFQDLVNKYGYTGAIKLMATGGGPDSAMK